MQLGLNEARAGVCVRKGWCVGGQAGLIDGWLRGLDGEVYG